MTENKILHYYLLAGNKKQNRPISFFNLKAEGEQKSSELLLYRIVH